MPDSRTAMGWTWGRPHHSVTHLKLIRKNDFQLFIPAHPPKKLALHAKKKLGQVGSSVPTFISVDSDGGGGGSLERAEYRLPESIFAKRILSGKKMDVHVRIDMKLGEHGWMLDAAPRCEADHQQTHHLAGRPDVGVGWADGPGQRSFLKGGAGQLLVGFFGGNLRSLGILRSVRGRAEPPTGNGSHSA